MEAGGSALIEELAEKLVARHVSISVPSKAARDLDFSDGENWEEHLDDGVRCIAVVGAGASRPILSGAVDLAAHLEKNAKVPPEEVNEAAARLAKIYGLDRSHFETRLLALNQASPGAAAQIRAAISSAYRVRHPTLLVYELLAHLLKHRFLDAIISMNFDELLDQSLDDELGANEYRRLIGSRDCDQVITNVTDLRYLPLYIKMHGTASEPESLRYTSEAYYDLPPSLIDVSERLLKTGRLIILNVGFGMTGFDFHQLLSQPREVEVYDFSPEAVKALVRRQINEQRLEVAGEGERPIFGPRIAAILDRGERSDIDELLTSTLGKVDASRPLVDRLDLARRPPTPLSEGALMKEFASVDLTDAARQAFERDDKLPHRIFYRHLGVMAGEQDVDQGHRQMTDSVLKLVRSIEATLDNQQGIHTRSIERHLAIDRLLGPQSIAGERLAAAIHSAAGAAPQRPDRSVYAGYLRRRTVLELVFAATKANGLQSISSLAIDRAGEYFARYQSESDHNPEFDWHDLCSLAALKEAKAIPDVLILDETVSKPLRGPLAEHAGYQAEPDDAPRQVDIAAYVKKTIDEIVDGATEEDARKFHDTLSALHEGEEIELHSQDDRICRKTFREPLVLKTRTALRAYTGEMLKDLDEGDSVDAIAETGGWLLDDKLTRALKPAGRVRLLIAFDHEDVEKVVKALGRHLQISIIKPWRHNRHMTVVSPLGDSSPHDASRNAIYFARRQRSAYVTPVALHHPADVTRIRRLFDLQWDEGDLVYAEKKWLKGKARRRTRSPVKR